MKSPLNKKIFQSKAGSALMMAIFTVTLLMVIATEIVYQTSVEHLISAQGVHGVQAYYAAKAGAEISLLRVHIYRKAIAQFGSSLPNKSMLDPIWNVPFAWPPVLPGETSSVDKDLIKKAVKASGMSAQYLATIEPESGKIDVNDLASKSDAVAKAARQELSLAIQNKVDTDEAFASAYRGFNFEKLYDSIRFYASDSKEDTTGLASAYGARATDFMPPHRPLQTVQELHLIPGMTDRIFDAIAPRVTVFGSMGINVNYATKEVLMSIHPQITLERAKLIVERRDDKNRGPFKDLKDFIGFLNGIGISGNPFEAGKDALGNDIVPPLFFDSESNFRIRSTGVSGKVTREVTAIIYDFDRVKARIATLAPAPTPTPGSAPPQIAPQTPGPSPSPTPTPAPIKIPNERPNVVYWSEN